MRVCHNIGSLSRFMLISFSKAFDCKDSANERNVSSLTNCRVQPILCKGTKKNKMGLKTIVLFVTYHKMNKKYYICTRN